MGLFDFFKSDTNKPSVDLTDFKFLSDDHTRIENGRPTSANNKGAWRGIRVKTSDNVTFFVTMYNMNENHPVWGDNIQMAEKRMKLIEENNQKIILRGFGTDAMGASFADYGLTLHKSGNNVSKVTLHMHDRSIDIAYEKAENKKQAEILNQYSTEIFNYSLNDFDIFRKQLLGLPSNLPYKCDVYKADGQKLINNENGYLEIDRDEIILQTFDDSNDYITFYNSNGKLFCKYVIMNGETIIVNEGFDKVEFKNRENQNLQISFECSKK